MFFYRKRGCVSLLLSCQCQPLSHRLILVKVNTTGLSPLVWLTYWDPLNISVLSSVARVVSCASSLRLHFSSNGTAIVCATMSSSSPSPTARYVSANPLKQHSAFLLCNAFKTLRLNTTKVKNIMMPCKQLLKSVITLKLEYVLLSLCIVDNNLLCLRIRTIYLSKSILGTFHFSKISRNWVILCYYSILDFD